MTTERSPQRRIHLRDAKRNGQEPGGEIASETLLTEPNARFEGTTILAYLWVAKAQTQASKTSFLQIKR